MGSRSVDNEHGIGCVRPEWSDDLPPESLAINGKSPGPDRRDVAERCPFDRAPLNQEHRSEVIGERGGAGIAPTIDGDHDPASAVIVQDLIDQRAEDIVLLRCPAFHGLTVSRTAGGSL